MSTDEVNPQLPAELRAYLRKIGSKGGKVGGRARGAVKARRPEQVQAAVRERLRKRRGLVLRHSQLLAIALDVGSFLERLEELLEQLPASCAGKVECELQRRALCERLYAVVTHSMKRRKLNPNELPPIRR
jgi:hypothetical protein